MTPTVCRARKAIGAPFSLDGVRSREDVLAARLGKIVAVDADGRTVRARAQRARTDVEMIDAALCLDDLLKDVGRCAARKILINDEERSGLLDRPDDRVTEIERQQRADVDDLDVDVRRGQVLRGLERDATQGSVSDDRDVCALTQQLRNTERQRELADVRRSALLEAIA